MTNPLKLLFILWLCYTMLFVGNIMVYDRGVYDCSNMCADQGYLLEKLGLDVLYVIDHEKSHAYLYIVDLHMYWECTGLYPRFKTENAQAYSSIESLYIDNPYHSKSDFDNGVVISKLKMWIGD